MSRKEENAKKASWWIDKIENNTMWQDAIQKSTDKTFVRKDVLITEDERSFVEKKSWEGSRPTIEIKSETTYDAIRRLQGYSNFIAVLNFASYFNPGGGFMKGAYSQEETLCQVSGLYPILKYNPIYHERRQDKDTPVFYKSQIIYSPMVPFAPDDSDEPGAPITIDVISCAAPNCNRIPMSKKKELEKIIYERLEACMVLPYQYGCETLILGAWGCGVFKNDPQMIANTFSTLIRKYGNAYKRIVFAIPMEDTKQIFINAL